MQATRPQLTEQMRLHPYTAQSLAAYSWWVEVVRAQHHLLQPATFSETAGSPEPQNSHRRPATGASGWASRR